MDQLSAAVILGYALTLASALLCVVWGILRWNRAGKADEPEQAMDRWATDEDLKSGNV